ncbi:MAG: hypothetical protein ABSA30_08305, partial [Candidatus Aminicenantales bacterium]
MRPPPPLAAKIDYETWNASFAGLAGRIPPPIPAYLGTPRCFVELDGDSRLRSLRFDNSSASLRLWSFL